MTGRFFIFLFLSCVLVHAQQGEREMLLAQADTLIEAKNIDSSYALILQAEAIEGGPEIDFRKDMLNIFEENWVPEEALKSAQGNIDLYLKKEIPGALIARYSGFVVENIIPHNELNEENLALATRNLQLLEEDMDSFLLMHYLHNIGNLKNELGDYFGAEEDLNRARKIASKIDTRNPSMEAIITYNYSDALAYLERHLEGYEVVELAADLMEKVEEPNDEYLIAIYGNLVHSALEYGYVEKASNYLLKIENLLESIRDKYDPAWMSYRDMQYAYNKMLYYSYTEKREEALVHLKATEEKFRGVAEDYFRLRLAAMNNSVGELYVIKEPLESFKYYRRGQHIHGKPEDYAYSLMFEFNIAKAYINSEQYDKALDRIEYILSKAEPIDDYRLPFFYFLKYKVLLAKGDFEGGLVVLDQVISRMHNGEESISIRDDDVVDEYMPDQDITTSYLMSGAAETIELEIPTSRETMEVMNKLYRMAIKHFQATYPGTLLSEKSNLEYEKMLEGLLRTDLYLERQSLSFAEVIKFSENANSRNLWEQFKAREKSVALLDEGLVRREAELRNQIVRLKKQVDYDEGELFDLEVALENVEEEKRSKFNSYYKYEDFSFDYEDFRASLGADEVALRYEFLDTVLYAFTISNEGERVYMLDSAHVVEKKVLAFTELLRGPASSVDKIQALGSDLYLMLLPFDLEAEEWLVCLDGVLNYLPFELLVKDDQYLLEDKLIRYATSFAIMEDASRAEVREALVVAPSYDKYVLSDQQLAMRGAAYNLEGALAEADAIADIIPASELRAAQASKEEFMAMAGDYDLLHLSMHSFMNDEDPSLSSLVFHDDVDDNELYVEELYGMKLNASLVVLSACNTGIGTVTTGEGMVSVNRAFTYAGVPSIVSSLWSAPDLATKDVMTSFYKELRSGKPKDEALRNAKLRYLASDVMEQQKHPFYWAGFVLHGNPEPVEFAEIRMGRWLWMGVGLIFAFLLLGLIFRKPS